MIQLLLFATVASVLTGSSVRHGVAAQVEGGRPNIVIMIADDMGFSDLGCYGGEIETPNLDQLAAGGLRFTQFYNTARCWPTRACILTGYYAQQVRMDPPKGRLPRWTRVLPHYLKPLGYRSYHSGKWHLRGAPRPVQDGGFDRSYLVQDQDRFFSPKRTSMDDKPLPPVHEGSGYYATTAIAKYGVEFLREHAAEHDSRPFFLYLAFTSPHFPLHALQEDIDRYRQRYLVGWDMVRRGRFRRLTEAGIIHCRLSQREPDTIPHWNFSAEKLFADIGPGEAPRAVSWDELSEQQRTFQATKMAIHAAMIDRMDREIGRVLEQIKVMGAHENTAVFFLSDNGASAEQIIRGDMHDTAAPPGSAKSYLCLGPGWSTAANTPFRRHKSWVHEGGIATPLIAYWPAGISARGQLRHDVGHCIDFAPTMLEMARGTATEQWNGVDVPPLPGKSLVPAFAQDGMVERDFLFLSHGGNHAVRVGDWKLVSARDEDVWELHDLSMDRSESANLASQHPERVRQMEDLWNRLDDDFRRLAESP
jgi:arylsulfatase